MGRSASEGRCHTGEVMHVQMQHAIKRNITFTSDHVAPRTLVLISQRF